MSIDVLKKFEKKWYLQSSAVLESSELGYDGEYYSSPSYEPAGWFEIDVPNTVLSGLVHNGVYPDPHIGENLRKIPGFTDVIPNLEKPVHNFVDVQMPKDSPFRVSWWYLKPFFVPSDWKDKKIWVAFKGINYKAEIWLNGKRIAAQGYTEGAFRIYEFEIGSRIVNGRNNLAVEVFSPKAEDLVLTFCDWNPLVPDKCMGIWQGVSLISTGKVRIKNAFVTADLDVDSFSHAKLEVVVDLKNADKTKVAGTLNVEVEGVRISKNVTIDSMESMSVKLSSEEYKELILKNPHVWWPYQMGNPEMTELKVSFEADNELSDILKTSFGIRKVESYLNEFGSRTFKINGKDILIRGAGWSPELMLRQSVEKDERDIAYLKNMNLNAVRLEGNMASDEFWDICDREGVLVLSGWSCCCYWERWDRWKEGDVEIALACLRDQLVRLRNHPSFIVWFYGSDNFPPVHIEKRYIETLKKFAPGLPYVSDCTDKTSPLNGPSGVKMTGPYAYVPPSYWYNDNLPGVAKGFNTEAGPDVCIPPIESLRKMYPDGNIAVGDSAWRLHTGIGVFANTILTDRAIELRYKKPDDLEQYCAIAKMLSYECWRSVYEAYGRNFPEGTGFIAWLLNSPWPSLFWHFYDTYWMPIAGFYAVQNACKMLHVQYSYDDSSIVLVNQHFHIQKNLQTKVRVLDLALKEIFSKSENSSLESYERKRIIQIPECKDISDVYYVDLTLEQDGIVIDRNFYWISKKSDLFTDTHPFYHTPLRSHGDMSSLFSIPKASVDAVWKMTEADGWVDIEVNVKNDSEYLALQTEVKILNSVSNEPVLPILWEENYITVFPGETRKISGKLKKEDHDMSAFVLKTEGFNVPAKEWNRTDRK